MTKLQACHRSKVVLGAEEVFIKKILSAFPALDAPGVSDT